jgi:hypothetical protein
VAWIPQPTERHREVLGRLLVSHGARANLVPDAHRGARDRARPHAVLDRR